VARFSTASLDRQHAVHEVREQAELYECCGCGEQTELRRVPDVGEGNEADGATRCDRDAGDGDLVRLDAAAAEPAGKRGRARTPARLQRPAWSGLSAQRRVPLRMESTLRTLGRLPDCVDPGRHTNRFAAERIRDSLLQRHGVSLPPSFREQVVG
jgi:hypothetical protein